MNRYIRYIAYHWFNIDFINPFPRASIKAIEKANEDSCHNLIGVEVGVYKGENAKSILKTLNIDKLYLIDPYVYYDDYGDVAGGQKTFDKLLKKTIKTLQKYENKYILIKKTANDALPDIPNNLDFVYIDGNHKYEYVKQDIENYYPKLKSGGILAGHDIENGEIAEHDGIVKAVLDFAHKHKLQVKIKSPDWLLVKP
jgi:predicted O-methyltransferase YrrM